MTLTGDCSNWQAWYERLPRPGKPSLNITGRCTFPTPGYSVKLILVETQGTTYIVERIVQEPTGPQPQVLHAVDVYYREETDVMYEKVHIRPDEVSVPVGVAP